MANQNFAVLQIGSSRLHVLVGRRGVANTFIVAGEGRADYGGYANGVFCEPGRLGEAILTAVGTAESTSGEKITHLTVGVPTDFCRVSINETSISFDKPHKVTLDDIRTLFANGNEHRDDSAYRLINKSPVYYMTDDGRKVLDVLGTRTAKLGLKASYVFAETAFLDIFTQALNGSGVQRLDYVSTAFAQMLFLFPGEARKQSRLLIDVGSGDTAVVFAQGEGVVSMQSFACGGEFFTMDLCMCFHVRYDIADRLKHQAVLSLKVDEQDKYSVVNNAKSLTYPARDVNAIIMDRLTQICDLIKRCVNTCPVPLLPTQEVYLTGGGLLHLRGAKDYLAKKLGRNVIPIAPRQPLYDKPELSQVLALLDLVLHVNED